jgi:glycosyltransferase involved in cell wall biosynthesis
MNTVRFIVIGVAPDAISPDDTPPDNVDLRGFMEQADLLQYYQRAKVYCQPSYIEGLPNSVCEAMLCGCVPVGTDVGGIPNAIGGFGFLVAYGDPDLLKGAIEQALAAPAAMGERARAHVAMNFAIHSREEGLLRVLEEKPH